MTVRNDRVTPLGRSVDPLAEGHVEQPGNDQDTNQDHNALRCRHEDTAHRVLRLVAGHIRNTEHVELPPAAEARATPAADMMIVRWQPRMWPAPAGPLGAVSGAWKKEVPRWVFPNS